MTPKSENSDLASARRRGDRHLGSDPGRALKPVEPEARHVVRLYASSLVAATAAGQHTLWMAINLLARQFGVIAEFRIAVPSCALVPSVALLGSSGNLSETLTDLARSIATDAMKVVQVAE